MKIKTKNKFVFFVQQQPSKQPSISNNFNEIKEISIILFSTEFESIILLEKNKINNREDVNQLETF